MASTCWARAFRNTGSLLNRIEWVVSYKFRHAAWSAINMSRHERIKEKKIKHYVEKCGMFCSSWHHFGLEFTISNQISIGIEPTKPIESNRDELFWISISTLLCTVCAAHFYFGCFFSCVADSLLPITTSSIFCVPAMKLKSVHRTQWGERCRKQKRKCSIVGGFRSMSSKHGKFNRNVINLLFICIAFAVHVNPVHVAWWVVSWYYSIGLDGTTESSE